MDLAYRFISLSALFIWLTGCAFVPKVADKQRFADDCSMATRQLDVDVASLEINSCKDDELLVCLVGYGVVIPGLTFAVSGSAVLTGNIIHWLEYKGRCEA